MNILTNFFLRFIISTILLRASLGERIHLEEDVDKVKLAPSAGSREMTFTLPQVSHLLKSFCVFVNQLFKLVYEE